jgi:hypothetical protein
MGTESGFVKITRASPFLAPSGVEYSFTFLSLPSTEKRISVAGEGPEEEVGGRTHFFLSDITGEAGDVDATIGFLSLGDLRGRCLSTDAWVGSSDEGKEQEEHHSLGER